MGLRILLGVLTALIVARPLVAGDDPGRLRLTSGGGPLWLNLLSFALLLGWAVWRGVMRRRLVIGPYLLFVAGLLVVAGFHFASAAQPDRYQRPGWFIAWDWVACAALAFVAGQLAIEAPIIRGLSAVLIATGGALAGQAMYETAAQEGNVTRGAPERAAPLDIPLVGDDHYDLRLNDPPPPVGAFRATLDEPDTLTAILLLGLPALILWACVGLQKGGKGNWLPLIALIVFVAAAMSLISWLVGSGMAGKGTRAALAIIRDRPILGCGPGNFSRNAPWGIADAGNFWMTVGATAGLGAMLAFALMLGSWGGIVIARRRRPATDDVPNVGRDFRWSFYIGGMGGLLLGMMLAMSDLPAEIAGDQMLRLGAVAAGRSVVWFLIFAALECAMPAVRRLTASLAVGVALVAAFGGVSNGLSSPALLVPFAIALTLSLSSAAPITETRSLSLPAAWIAAPIALALVMGNFMHVGIPGLFTSVSARDARAASAQFGEIHQRTVDPNSAEPEQSLLAADNILLEHILIPLKEAAKLDRGNSALFSEIAMWERLHIHYLFLMGEFQRGLQRTKEILQLDEAIARIDPRNPTPRFSELEAMLFLIRRSRVTTPGMLNRLEQLARHIVEYDAKREVAVYYRMVAVLLTRRNPEAADAFAVRLLQLDGAPGEPHGKLSPRQRQLLLVQLKRIKEPSAELARLLNAR